MSYFKQYIATIVCGRHGGSAGLRVGVTRVGGMHSWCRRGGLAGLAVSACVLMFGVAPVLGAVGHEYLSQITQAPASEPLGAPNAIAIDPQDNVWVFDRGKGVMDELGAHNEYKTQWSGEGHFPEKGINVTSIAVAPSSGDLYVAEPKKEAIDVFQPSGKFVEEWAGVTTPQESFGLKSPITVASDPGSGAVYVDNPKGGVIDEFKANGEYECQWPSPSVNRVSIAAANGNLFVLASNETSGNLYEYRKCGELVLEKAGMETPAVSFLLEPGAHPEFQTKGIISGVATDPAGDIYIADTDHKVVDELDSTGKYVGQFNGGATPSGHFIYPGAIAANAAGDVYVADYDPTLALEKAAGVVDVFGPSASQDTLKVAVTGGAIKLQGEGGNSSVASSPAGIEEMRPCFPHHGSVTTGTCEKFSNTVDKLFGCEDVCSTQFAPGQKVVLTETPVSGIEFLEWVGAGCSGSKEPACEVTLGGDVGVTAEFRAIAKSPVEVIVEPPGAGTVRSQPSGIECSSACSFEFHVGEKVKLTGEPDPSSTFTGWSVSGSTVLKGCAAMERECEFEVTGSTKVQAIFAPIPQKSLTVTETGGGAGTVVSSEEPPSIECPITCTHFYNEGAVVTLVAYAGPTSTFAGWTGCEAEPRPDECRVTLAAAVEVKADFAPVPQETLTVTKTGAGMGTVVDATGAIDCGQVCAHVFSQGTTVTLTATPGGNPASASAFAGWSGGGCSGTGPCQVTLATAAEVTAEFTAIGPEACPNEALRRVSDIDPLTGNPASSELPECRAYELVTPAFKEGALTVPFAVSPDGSRMVVKSLGDFGDAGDNPSNEGATYELSRGSSGWSSVNLDPPASLYPWDQYLDASPDLGETLWYLRAASQSVYAADLYVRDAGGMLHDLGSIQPTSATEGLPGTGRPADAGGGDILDHFGLAGASSDLSHVLFGISSSPATEGPLKGVEPLWPSDETVAGVSLYEYALGRGGEPLLVGVNDAGKLIGRCGVTLAHGSHPVSSDGSIVYFVPVGEDQDKCGAVQPPVAEIFARVDSGEPGAHTVSISEPSAQDCEACNTTTGLKDAVFQGASEGGSKVFFTTEQELLPGRRGANLYEYDFQGPVAGAGHPDGRITAVTDGEAPAADPELEGVLTVSPDGSHVYFLARAVLTTGANGVGAQARRGASNLYVYDTTSGRTAFVATLAPSDGTPRVAVTPDGRFLVFASHAHLTPDDTSSVSQVFRYDASTGQLLRVSIGQEGFADDGNDGQFGARLSEAEANVNVGQVARAPATVSADGSRVVFESIDGLTPRAVNDRLIGESENSPHELTPIYADNAYLWHEGDLSLLSDGRDETFVAGSRSSVGMLGLSASGGDAFFTTSDPLVGQDTDTEQDVYDARIDGGFPAPSQAPSCVGEECQGSVSAPLVFSSPPSTMVPGEGNAVAPIAAAPAIVRSPAVTSKRKSLKCSKGRRLSRGRCVKVKARKRAKAKGKRGTLKGRTHGRGK